MNTIWGKIIVPGVALFALGFVAARVGRPNHAARPESGPRETDVASTASASEPPTAIPSDEETTTALRLPSRILSEARARINDQSFHTIGASWDAMDYFERRFFLATLVEKDPRAGWEFLRDKDIKIAEYYRFIALDRIARVDPELAVKLLSEGTQSRQAISARMEALMRGWMTKDLPAAAAFLAHNTTLPVASRTYGTVLKEMLQRQGSEATIAWIDSIARSDGFERAARLGCDQLIHANPQLAAQWLSRHVDQDFVKNLLPKAVSSYAILDPVASAKLVDSLPGGKPRWNSVITLSTTWAVVDAAGLSNWIETQPVRPYRDIGKGELASHLVSTDAARALQLLDEIETLELRDHYIPDVLRRVSGGNDAQLRDAINRSAVSSDLLRRFEKISQETASRDSATIRPAGPMPH